MQHSLQVAVQSAASPIILITGSNAQTIEKEVHNKEITIIENQDWEEGISSSIRCGLKALQQIMPGAEQAIFMVCDQPFVSASLINQLIEARNNTGKGIIACAYAETIGTPVLCTKNYFPELLTLQGNEGAKKIVMKYKNDLGIITFPQGEIDIDTWNDYNNLLETT